MSIDAARALRARERVQESRAWSPEIVAAEGLLAAWAELAVLVIENTIDNRSSICANGLLEDPAGRGRSIGEDVMATKNVPTIWDAAVTAAWNAYASGLFGHRDIHVPVNAALAPLGVSVLPKHALDALRDTETAERVVKPHIREAVQALHGGRGQHVSASAKKRKAARQRCEEVAADA